MAAVMAGMIIQSTSVSFGAAGTPILVGVNTGLSADPAVAAYALQLGYAEWNDFLALIGLRVAMLHALAGTLVPLILVSAMTRFFGKSRSFAEGLQVWKFALFAALSMTVPYLAAAYLLGPEFPALLGSLTGLAIVVTAARRGFLVPPPEQCWDFESKERWPADWTGSIQPRDVTHHSGSMGMFKAWSPYVLVALLLLLTRLRALPFGGWLQSWTVSWPEIFGTSVSASVQPLFLPGTIFIVVSLATWALHRIPGPAYRQSWTTSLRVTAAASVALVFTVPMVQVFINSGGGAAGFDRMPIALADGVAALAGLGLADLRPVHRRHRGGRRRQQYRQQHDVLAVPVRHGRADCGRSHVDRRAAGGRRRGRQHDLRAQRRRGFGRRGPARQGRRRHSHDDRAVRLLRAAAGRGRLRHRFVRDQRIAECRNPAGAGDRRGGGGNDRAVPRAAGARRLGGRSAA